MRHPIVVLIIFILKGQLCLAFQSDTLSRYEAIKDIISRNAPPIKFNEMNSKYFGFSFLVNVTKDSLIIQYSDNFSEEQIKSVPKKFSKKVNEEYQLFEFRDVHSCVLIVPVLYKTYTSLDVPVGFEKAISNLIPRSEILKLECLYVIDPIFITGQYRYTKKDDDFW